VRQHNSGAVEDFILPYSAVYLQIQKWKNYWNRSTFAKVIVKIKVARFLWPTVWGAGKNGPGKNGPDKNGPEKRVQVKTVLGKNGPGKKGPSDYFDSG